MLSAIFICAMVFCVEFICSKLDANTHLRSVTRLQNGFTSYIIILYMQCYRCIVQPQLQVAKGRRCNRKDFIVSIDAKCILFSFSSVLVSDLCFRYL